MSEVVWTPPAGMAKQVVRDWKEFYRRVLVSYGITPAEYQALYLAQLGRCYICQKAKGIHPDDPKGLGGRRLGVDHNHLIGNGKREAVRGLLCTGSLSANTCNRLIAYYDHAALVRASIYLEKPPAQWVFRALEAGWDSDEVKGMVARS